MCRSHFTTARTIEERNEILRRVREARNQVQPLTTRAGGLSQIAEQHPHLQQGPEDRHRGCPESIRPDSRIIQGYAGVGKTRPLTALRSSGRSAGIQSLGFRARRHGPRASSARPASRLGPCRDSLRPRRLVRTRPERKHFSLVDESSLASTNQVRAGAVTGWAPNDRPFLIGDIRQHQGVEAGQPFEQLQQSRNANGKSWTKLFVQKDPPLKSAVELLAKGQSSAAFDLLPPAGSSSGRFLRRAERIRALVAPYTAADSPLNTLIISPDNASRRELNLPSGRN